MYSPSYSSNDDIAASDEPFMDSDYYDEMEINLYRSGFFPPLTEKQIALLRNVAIYAIEDTDSPDQVKNMFNTAFMVYLTT